MKKFLLSLLAVATLGLTSCEKEDTMDMTDIVEETVYFESVDKIELSEVNTTYKVYRRDGDLINTVRSDEMTFKVVTFSNGEKGFLFTHLWDGDIYGYLSNDGINFYPLTVSYDVKEYRGEAAIIELMLAQLNG